MGLCSVVGGMESERGKRILERGRGRKADVGRKDG